MGPTNRIQRETRSAHVPCRHRQNELAQRPGGGGLGVDLAEHARLVLANRTDSAQPVRVQLGGRMIPLSLDPRSFSTLVLID